MTQKKKYSIIGGVVASLLIVAGIAWYCLSGGSNDKYASALPQDVTMVGRINAKDLVVENGLSLSDLKNVLFSSDNSGVDYSETAFIFAHQGYFGAIVPMADTKKFLEFAHCDVEEQRGLSWGVVGGGFLVAADDDKAMIIGPAVGAEQDALRNTLYTCMTQKEGGDKSEIFKRLQERDEPVAIATSLAALPEMYGKMVKGYMPKGVNQEDFLLTAGLTAHKNEVSLGIGLEGDGKAGGFLDKLDEALQPIDASLYSSAPKNPFFHLEAGLDGEKLIALLRENPDVRTQLLAANMVFDLDMILKSIKGDVALTVPKLGLFDQPMLFQANVQDDKFMQNVAGWNEGATQQAGIQFLPAQGNVYKCVGQGMTCYFGTQNKRLFVTNTEKYAQPQDGKNEKLSGMKDCRLFATVDISKLTDMLTLFANTGNLESLERLNVRCEDARHWTLTIQATEGVDILKSLMK